MIYSWLNELNAFPNTRLAEHLKSVNVNRQLEFEIIILILQEYNPRISEILNMVPEDIIQNKFIILHGLKNSADIIINNPMLVGLINTIKKPFFHKVFSVKYSQVYKYILKNHSSMVIVRSNKNNSVTHSMRYKNSTVFKLSNQSEKTIKSLLHHNSLKSQKYYLKGILKNGKNT